MERNGLSAERRKIVVTFFVEKLPARRSAARIDFRAFALTLGFSGPKPKCRTTLSGRHGGERGDGVRALGGSEGRRSGPPPGLGGRTAWEVIH